MTDSSKPLAWITGAGGLIGSHVAASAARFAPSWRVRGWARSELDLLDFPAVERAFKHDRPNLVIHCAALSNTPACEKDPILARRMNVEVTALLADLAAGVRLLFFSTDMVFDGLAGNYDELAAVNPLGVYGATKAEAEQVVLAHPRHSVVRTSLNFGISPTKNRGFNEQLRRTFERGEEMTLFADEFRCPIPVVVTARAVWEICQSIEPGLYHLAGSERLSRWQMGRMLADHWPELHPKIRPGSRKDFGGAPRPPDCSLNCDKLQGRLSFMLPGLGEWLGSHPADPM